MMVSSGQMSALRKKCASIKASYARIRTFVEAIGQIIPELINFEERKEKLANYWSDYNTVQFELEFPLCDDEKDVSRLRKCSST